MIPDQKVRTCFALFYPTASATAYGQRPKFVRAEHSATAEGENCAYGPTLLEPNYLWLSFSGGHVIIKKSLNDNFFLQITQFSLK